MTGTELSRRERKKEETKERIFAAAFSLFKEKGFEATTVDDISAKADVAKGTFFNYFPRKESVLGYLNELWLLEAEEQAEAILAERPSGAKLGAKLLDMFTSFASAYEEDRALSKHVIMEWMKRAYSGTDDTCVRWHNLGVRVLKGLQESGEVRSDIDPERAEFVLGSVYMGTLMMWLDRPDAGFGLRD